MSQVEKQRTRLISLLKELFQLDQPDLDFGFYRIMHAKAGQVSKFLEEDLLGIIREAFGEADDARIAEAKAAYDAARKQAVDYGAPDPDATEPVMKAKAAWDAAKDSGSNEGDVYDHLYRFFERYYDSGDFMSRRYFARETDGKAAPYAVPYDGREVYLHWANRDQYYIKTSEYLTNFTFDPTQAKEFKGHHGELFGEKPLKVHCRVVSASEGEHNNVKASEQTERYFIIHGDEPVKVEIGETGAPELVIQFEYRADTEKTGQDGTWRKKRLAEAVEAVEAALPQTDQAEDYVKALLTPAPTEAEKDRTLLAKYLAQYTGRNTMDYFIHKDLGGFLKRELDFYIKNEVMRLDDIEAADAPRVETYLAKVKVLRRIAQHLIEFLAQLEDFQKKLWLKKKFVLDTQYCITLDRIPEKFYPEIAANEAQREEWVKLFGIDKFENYQEPVSIEFLESHPSLVIDTCFFEKEFQDNLISEIDGLDEQLDGLLVHSENFQAARLLSRKLGESLGGVYLDPPYNTDASEIIYKNGYKNSSWASLIFDRLQAIKKLMRSDAAICITIDDFEKDILRNQMDIVFGSENDLATAVIRSNPQGRSTVQGFAVNHEYGLFYRNSPMRKTVGRLERSEKQIGRYREIDESGQRFLWENFRKTGTDSSRVDRPKQFYPIVISGTEYRIPDMEWDEIAKKWNLIEELGADEKIVLPVDDDGNERVWKWGYERVLQYPNYVKVVTDNSKGIQIYRRNDLNTKGSLPGTWWGQAKYGAGSHGTNMLTAMFGKANSFSFPKSLYAVYDSIKVITNGSKSAVIADFFAGSATSGHAVLELNLADRGKRKFILAEMGEYFERITKPRMNKAIFSLVWDAGKPKPISAYLSSLDKRISELEKSKDEISGIIDRDEYHFQRQRIEGEIRELASARESISLKQCENTRKDSIKGHSCGYKYLRLESYEDTLNNLYLRDLGISSQDGPFVQDYMLRYWLDFETKGSPSLLNIEQFSDPTNYKLNVKKPGTDEYVEKPIDLIETFNWLIGLHVEHIDQWRGYDAAFKREEDAELPGDTSTRLMIDGSLKETEDGAWRFRKIEGYTLRTPGDQSDRERGLVVWRKLTGDLEHDNLMLDEWFRKYRLSAQDTEFDVIYVNGSNNLPNLRQEEETWKVRLIEEAFHQAMWDVEG